MRLENIVTPCHGVPLTIYTSPTGGSGYQTYEVVDEIICSAKGCHNYWDAEGVVQHWKAPE